MMLSRVAVPASRELGQLGHSPLTCCSRLLTGPNAPETGDYLLVAFMQGLAPAATFFFLKKNAGPAPGSWPPPASVRATGTEGGRQGHCEWMR